MSGSRYRVLQTVTEEDEEIQEDLVEGAGGNQVEESNLARPDPSPCSSTGVPGLPAGSAGTPGTFHSAVPRVDTLSQTLTATARSLPSQKVSALRAPKRPEQLWSLQYHLRRALWPTTGPRDRELVKAIRRLIRPLQKQYQGELMEYRHKVQKRKLRSNVEAIQVQKSSGEFELSYDVEEKKEEIGRHLRDRVEDEEARKEVQEILDGMAKSLDSSQRISVSLHDVLRARTRLKSGAAGPDEVSKEMIALLPFSCVKKVRYHFERIANREQDVPTDWKQFLVTLLPKSPSIDNLNQTRAICLLSLVQKWYNHVLVLKGEQWLNSIKHGIHMYGFVQFRKVAEITSLTKHLSQHAAQWGKLEQLFLASLDVFQAFDHVTVKLAVECMRKLNFDPALIHALLNPMTENTCKGTFEGVQNTEWVGWDRSIRTGGVDGPFILKVVCVALWQDVFRSGGERGLGYVVEAPVPLPPKSYVSHALWADNLLLYANSEKQLKQMIHELTLPLLQNGLSWKPSSLQYIPFGVCGSSDIVISCDKHTFALTCVDQLDVLGYRIDLLLEDTR